METPASMTDFFLPECNTALAETTIGIWRVVADPDAALLPSHIMAVVKAPRIKKPRNKAPPSPSASARPRQKKSSSPRPKHSGRPSVRKAPIAGRRSTKDKLEKLVEHGVIIPLFKNVTEEDPTGYLNGILAGVATPLVGKYDGEQSIYMLGNNGKDYEIVTYMNSSVCRFETPTGAATDFIEQSMRRKDCFTKARMSGYDFLNVDYLDEATGQSHLMCLSDVYDIICSTDDAAATTPVRNPLELYASLSPDESPAPKKARIDHRTGEHGRHHATEHARSGGVDLASYLDLPETLRLPTSDEPLALDPQDLAGGEVEIEHEDGLLQCNLADLDYTMLLPPYDSVQ